MKFAIDCAKLLALTALIILLGEASWTLHKVRVPLVQAADNANTAIIAIQDAAVNLDGASQIWQTTQEQVAKDSTNVLIESKATLAQLRKTASTLDASALTLSSAMQKAIDTNSQSLLETQTSLRESLTGMNQATILLQRDLDSANKILSSPEIQKTLDNLAASSQNAAEASRHLSNITEAGENTAKYYEKRLTTPQSFFKTVAQAILQLGSQARILLAK